METFKRELWQSARILIIVLVLSVGVQYVYAWTGPTAAPPDGNVPAPINTSVGDQKKTGGLIEIFNRWINGALGVTGGASFGGNVGIGTASPLQKLSVAGTIESTSGGFKFPDGTTQTTAGGSGTGSDTVVTFSAIRFYTSTQTWTKPSNLSYIVVEVWGGGGNGGSGEGSNNGGLGNGGGGGGSGGYAMRTMTSISLASSYTATVGAAGGTSNFGGLVSASGGTAGVGGYQSGGTIGGAGGAAGTGAGGDVNMTGNPGIPGNDRDIN